MKLKRRGEGGEGGGDGGAGGFGAGDVGVTAGGEVVRDDRAGLVDEDAFGFGAATVDADFERGVAHGTHGIHGSGRCEIIFQGWTREIETALRRGAGAEASAA